MAAELNSEAFQITAHSVIIRRPAGREYELPNLWLRDNCPCDDCRVVETQEKRFILSSVDADLAPTEVGLDNSQLSITWPDNHQTRFPLSTIDQLMIPEPKLHQPWPHNFTPETFDWSLFLTHSQTTVAGLTSFMRWGAIVLTGAPTQSESLELLSPVLGPIRELLFDRIHNVSVTGHVYNIAHTSLGLPPHNDFASYSFPPSVQALHMLQNETPGGESIIVDGWAILEQLRLDHPEYFKSLCEFPVPFREFDQDNETYATEPMVRCNIDGSIHSLRFSNQLMQMMNPMQPGIQQFYSAYRELCLRIMHRESAARSTFRLEGGQLLLVAAQRVLHARESFQPVAARHLQDAYFELDNVANKLRQLQASQKPE